jgi:salicylate hydroxylase
MASHINGDSHPARLSVLIVGGGPVGLTLAAGLAAQEHLVTVLERRPERKVEGGPVFMQRTACVAFEQLGMQAALEANSVTAQLTFWSYKDQKSETPLQVVGAKRVSGRMVQRPDAQRFALEAALDRGAKVLFGKNVVELDEGGAKPRVVTEDGQEFRADLIIAADGVKSRMRKFMLPEADTDAVPTTELIFHTAMPRDTVRADPRLASNARIIDSPGSHITMGPGRVNIFSAANEPSQPSTWAYSCILNYGPPPNPDTTWYRPGSAKELRQLFDDFPNKDRAALDLAEDAATYMWSIGCAPPHIPSWRGRSGYTLLIGDAAHGMMPHMGQGLTQGLEDVVALCHIVRRAKTADDLPQLLDKLERFRRPRVARIVGLAAANTEMFMLPDGPAQEARDGAMRAAGPPPADLVVVPDMNAPMFSPNLLKWLWEYDVVGELDRFLQEVVM